MYSASSALRLPLSSPAEMLIVDVIVNVDVNVDVDVDVDVSTVVVFGRRMSSKLGIFPTVYRFVLEYNREK